MAWLNPDNHVESSRVEVYRGELRFWINGKPESGVFMLSELEAAYGGIVGESLRSAIWSGRITVDATASRGYIDGA